jgi:hypothetical protein
MDWRAKNDTPKAHVDSTHACPDYDSGLRKKTEDLLWQAAALSVSQIEFAMI